MILFGGILLSGARAAKEYQTDEVTCIECYAGGAVGCINSKFTYSYCCDYSDQTQLDNCMAPYQYCTKNLKQSIYKVFTCPLFGCPNNNNAQSVSHTVFNAPQT